MSVISNLVSDLSGPPGVVLGGGEVTMKQEPMAPAFLDRTTLQEGQMTYKQPMDFSPAAEKLWALYTEQPYWQAMRA